MLPLKNENDYKLITNRTNTQNVRRYRKDAEPTPGGAIFSLFLFQKWVFQESLSPPVKTLFYAETDEGFPSKHLCMKYTGYRLYKVLGHNVCNYRPKYVITLHIYTHTVITTRNYTKRTLHTHKYTVEYSEDKATRTNGVTTPALSSCPPPTPTGTKFG